MEYRVMKVVERMEERKNEMRELMTENGRESVMKEKIKREKVDE